MLYGLCFFYRLNFNIMKRRLRPIMIAVFGAAWACAPAQTYVNDMLQEQVERDCYIEGGSALFNDESAVYYDDGSYVQKSSPATPTAFIFNRDVWGNKNLTGFIVNMLVPQDRDITQYAKVEYSTDEMNYHEIPDLKVETSYDDVKGGGYWADIWMQGALPEGVKEIKVTLLAKEDDANWIPCYRRTEIFYEGGTPYEYQKPPYLKETATDFAIDFETENYSTDMAGSQNATSTVEVVDNPLKSGINNSNRVLKIVQDPTDSNWGWENADWFGVAVGLFDGEDNRLTQISEEGRYLHFQILRAENSIFGMETWGGSCLYKDQEIPFTGSEDWQEVVIDLQDYMGTTFKQFYFSPNERYGTDNVSVVETTYLDNIYLSSESAPSGIGETTSSSVKVWGTRGTVHIAGEAGAIAAVYSVAGIHMGIYTLENGEVQIPLSPGVYLVKAGSTVSKVWVY